MLGRGLISLASASLQPRLASSPPLSGWAAPDAAWHPLSRTPSRARRPAPQDSNPRPSSSCARASFQPCAGSSPRPTRARARPTLARLPAGPCHPCPIPRSPSRSPSCAPSSPEPRPELARAASRAAQVSEEHRALLISIGRRRRQHCRRARPSGHVLLSGCPDTCTRGTHRAHVRGMPTTRRDRWDEPWLGVFPHVRATDLMRGWCHAGAVGGRNVLFSKLPPDSPASGLAVSHRFQGASHIWVDGSDPTTCTC